MPTIIGLIFLALGIYCFAKGDDWLLGLLVFSALFQASSVVNFGSVGIQPFYLIACIFLCSKVQKRFWKSQIRFRGERFLIIFGCLGVFSALVYPFIFAGIPVYSPKIGIDDGFLYRPPLEFSVGNLAQAAYLIVELLTVIAAASTIKSDKIRAFYNYCFSFFVGLLFLQFVCVQLGISFPYSLLQNNPGYSMAEVSVLDPTARVIGTFSEASGAGLVLVIFFAGYFYEFFSGTGSALKVMIAAIAIGLVRSSSALAAMFASVVLIIAFHPVYRFPWFLRGSRLLKITAVLAVVMLVVFSPFSATLREYTTEKNESVSYIDRTAADLFSLQLAADTHWVGVGLGSNRPSSLLTSLLSNVGIPGLILFLFLLVQIAKNLGGKDVWIRWALFAAVFDTMLGGPDITQPWIWIILTLATYHGAVYPKENRLDSSRAAADVIL